MKYLADISIFILYILTSGYGLTKMKSSDNIINNEFLVGFIFYGIGFVWWIVLLRRLPLSIAFPIAAGGLIVFLQFTGIYALDEKYSLVKLSGVTMIVAGIATVYYGSKS